MTGSHMPHRSSMEKRAREIFGRAKEKKEEK
jgi:hypothetical protein